jgi:hypothetical protein
MQQSLGLMGETHTEHSIDFSVLGSTKNTYTVVFNQTLGKDEKESDVKEKDAEKVAIADEKLDSNWGCTCPDFQQRGATCKHIYFVANRVLKLKENDITVAKILVAFEAAFKRGNDGVVKASERRAFLGESCCICFEDMTATCVLWWCQLQCGNSCHSSCIQRYIQHSADSLNKKPSCPHCRSEITHNE